MDAIDILDFANDLDGDLVYLGPQPERRPRPASKRGEQPKRQEPPKPPTLEERMAEVQAQTETGWAAADKTFTDMQEQIDRLHRESVQEKIASRLFWENFRRRVVVDAQFIFWALLILFFISVLVRVMAGPLVLH